MIKLSAIVAMSQNRVIGINNKLPWHLPEDLKRFKAITTGHPIIMGRKTYESIGRPLPNRRNIVVSSTLKEPPHQQVKVVASLEAAVQLLGGVEKAFVIGGGVLYAAAMPIVSVLHMTELD